MANDDLLHQFKKLLEENNKQLEQNFQKRQEENNKQLRLEIREDIRAEVDLLHERMDTQYKNLTGQINAVKTELSEKISQQSHEVADILAKAVMPDIDRHEIQIEELQKAVGLRPKH
jgi:hypothetical protein